MRFKLSKDAVWLLTRMIKSPMQLPLTQANMVHQSGMPRQFTSPDRKHAKKVELLQKWLEDKVLEAVTEDKEKPENRAWRPKDFEGSLTQTYIEILQEIVKFYEPIGMLAENVKVYGELADALDGKEHKLDSLDAITLDEPAAEKKE